MLSEEKTSNKKNKLIHINHKDTMLFLYPVMSSCGDPVSAHSNTFTFFPIKVEVKLLITGYNNNVVSCDEYYWSGCCFFLSFFFTQHEITCISCRVPLRCIVIDQINKLPEDGLKSSPKTSHYIENTWINQKIKLKLYFSYTLLIFYMF